MDKSALNRFFLNESTDSERKQVIGWLLNPENDLLIRIWMRENWNMISSIDLSNRSDNPDISKIWSSIQEGIKKIDKENFSIAEYKSPYLIPFRNRIKRFVAAAAIIIVLFSIAGYYLTHNKTSHKNLASSTSTNIIEVNDVAPPTGNKAMLTLADGTKVYLDSTGAGTLATQGSVQVIKKPNGEIVYSGSASNAVTYNTLSLPRGSKPIRLVLADGSLVWLNTASTVTYPTAFIGKERKVVITGEAYFEVLKNTSMPFYVSYKDMTVEVLGTHFNVNAYEDEKETKVTLLEGAVNVSLGQKTGALKPGQQAVVNIGNINIRNSADIDEVMAWKNGQFYFPGTDIKTIMRQIEKYYNVDVEYKDNIPYRFVAKISRDVNVSQFLERLELTNLVHFKIEGKKIIVTK